MNEHEPREDGDPALEQLLRATFRAEATRQLPDDVPLPTLPDSGFDRSRRRRRRWVGISTVAAGLVAAGVAAALLGHEALDAAPQPTTAATTGPSVSAPTTPSGTPSSTVTPTGGTTASSAPGTTAPAAAVGPTGGPVPAGFVPASATFVSADDGWVLGTTASCGSPPCTSIVRTRDGGRTWVGIPAPRATLSTDPTADVQVSSVRFADPLDGWVFGQQLWATHDGGASWHRVDGAVATGSWIADLETGGGSVYLATDPCPPQVAGGSACSATSTVAAAAVTSDSFTPLATLPYGTVHLAVHGTDWWASGRGSLVHGVGRNPAVPVASLCAADQPAALIAAVDSTHLDGLCFGPGGAGGSTQAQLLGSTDGGRSWTGAGPAFRTPSGVDQISDNGAGVLVLAAASGASSLARTTDDGGSFSVVLSTNVGEGQPWSDAGFTTAGQAFAVLPGQAMYLSTDAGATWGTVGFGG